MGKKASTFTNMTLTLFVITVVAGISLGYINQVTEGPIAQAKLQRTTNALNDVLPEFNNSPIDDMWKLKTEVVKDSIEIYPGMIDGERIGSAIVASSEKGYNGLIKIMVGFKPDGSIINIRVLEQKETPGLGTKIKNEKFISQYRDKNPATFNLKVKKDKGEVDAITGATITTRAYSEAVQLAYDILMENKTQEKTNE
ncbi:MAG: RnfABCDGE type electron transport complex subunit G [Bacteroidia bacterium]|nr:RnfABCDGE type electron transport complex subunit G [Bacteroidia bacterium]MBT8270374.1 RnfABCDGE type electron transport complex subunit G [Bacteroidia bacterium]NNF83407.1 RnfABCDGE type electron transport complex subunit G [Flavobacteriaceae bacterium]NNK70023.1 RnfABCDGE type electron transport complex subunit G [Flavobacteriaceae bacterium]NNL79451.1 RnfABCDGE type electron transport complex subunit G [Flavobacteriaceae bacterium]